MCQGISSVVLRNYTRFREGYFFSVCFYMRSNSLNLFTLLFYSYFSFHLVVKGIECLLLFEKIYMRIHWIVFFTWEWSVLCKGKTWTFLLFVEGVECVLLIEKIYSRIHWIAFFTQGFIELSYLHENDQFHAMKNYALGLCCLVHEIQSCTMQCFCTYDHVYCCLHEDLLVLIFFYLSYFYVER